YHRGLIDSKVLNAVTSKPVAFFDTETGSDWMIPLFEEVGIPLVVAKKRSFADLIAAMKWAEEDASVLVIDRLTPPWRGLQEADLVAPVIDAHLDAFDLDAVDDLGRQ
uniref:hypothetical protein n=1 Tax=Pseudomonas proteolytica TaxID=219574 RepID=UPI0030DB5287